MNPLQPVRCLSSQLTSTLLSFRNPQGLEENWVFQGQRINNYMLHYGKVLIAEVGLCILIGASMVEMTGYLAVNTCLVIPALITLGICSLLIDTRDNRIVNAGGAAFEFLSDLAKSSIFTVYWNFGNVFVFNPFYTNTFTHESFARFSIDFSPRGEVFRTLITVIHCAWIIASIAALFFGTHLPRFPIGQIGSHREYWTRACDNLFIADWITSHPNVLRVPIQALIRDPQFVAIARQGQDVNQHIESGVQFFTRYLLNPSSVTAETIELILTADPEVYTFALTRAVYIYSFGEKRTEALPLFFKPETRDRIESLRQTYTMMEGAFLANRMGSLEAFNAPIENEDQERIFTQLKVAGNTELQNSIFITRIWQQACEAHHAPN